MPSRIFLVNPEQKKLQMQTATIKGYARFIAAGAA
jgi:hypothetical protein